MWLEKQDAYNSHERHLETYIEKPLGAIDEQERSGEYKDIDAFGSAREHPAQAIAGKHDGSTKDGGMHADKEDKGP